MLRTNVVKPKTKMISLLLVEVVNSPPFGLRSDHSQIICCCKGLLSFEVLLPANETEGR